MDSQLYVRNQGELTLPDDVREKYGIRTGDILNLIDLGGVFVLSPIVPMVPKLAYEIERMRLEAGLSTADLMKGLREQREQYYVQNYANDEQD